MKNHTKKTWKHNSKKKKIERYFLSSLLVCVGCVGGGMEKVDEGGNGFISECPQFFFLKVIPFFLLNKTLH